MKDPYEKTTLMISKKLKEEAREYGINISAVARKGIDHAIKKAKEEKWIEDNRDAAESYNQWIEKNGLPLQAHWMEEDITEEA